MDGRDGRLQAVRRTCAACACRRAQLWDSGMQGALQRTRGGCEEPSMAAAALATAMSAE